MRELRHDFRHYYHVSYDETPIIEAIDLIHTLPSGSLYKSALSPYYEWDDMKIWQANVIDALSVINWRLMNCPKQYTPEAIERPWDRAKREAARKRANEIKHKIENTEWRDV